MIEITLLTHLAGLLDVSVSLEKPEPKPVRFVLLEKTGSGNKNRINSSTFAIQSYAESLYQAALLNEQVKLAMESLGESNQVGKVKLNSDYNFTDAETKEYRYQAVFDITY